MNLIPNRTGRSPAFLWTGLCRGYGKRTAASPSRSNRCRMDGICMWSPPTPAPSSPRSSPAAPGPAGPARAGLGTWCSASCTHSRSASSVCLSQAPAPGPRSAPPDGGRRGRPSSSLAAAATRLRNWAFWRSRCPVRRSSEERVRPGRTGSSREYRPAFRSRDLRPWCRGGPGPSVDLEKGVDDMTPPRCCSRPNVTSCRCRH